jgi:hypothetical protein
MVVETEMVVTAISEVATVVVAKVLPVGVAAVVARRLS